ncbi:MAG: MBL fold metallo-hydrolase [Lachnospiraceae bacterium]|nr:MBL fold metallo-hydrolase [Lachnospiraceae bacterium]
MEKTKEQLYVFGTGNAAVTRCYNTCFAIRIEDEFFMVDAGGGNGILGILERMQVPLARIHHIFVTHEHTDHILGIVWMIRMIGQQINKDRYQGQLTIYCHPALTETIITLCRLTTQEKIWKHIGGAIRLVPVEDGQELIILGRKVTFFDIHSTKATQFGFTMELSDGRKLACAGDEPCQPLCESCIAGSSWLLHEAFCLYGDREEFKPYEKHHSTVKEACQLAERLNIPNLILWHTEDSTLDSRKERYCAEGKQYYHGNLFVPDDREIITLTQEERMNELS